MLDFITFIFVMYLPINKKTFLFFKIIIIIINTFIMYNKFIDHYTYKNEWVVVNLINNKVLKFDF